MKGDNIKTGDLYRHFQGNLYQIVTVGKHSETLEEYIVYQALFGDFQVYVQNIQDFFGILDKEKYPEVQQKYCFEKIDKEELTTKRKSENLIQNTKTLEITEKDKMNMDTFVEESDNKEGMRLFLDFLDAETYKEKMEIFMKMTRKLDERLLTNIAVSLDLVVDEKNIDESCQIIMKNLEQRSNFECFRLR